MNTLCGQKVEIINVRPGGSYIKHQIKMVKLFCGNLLNDR